MKTLHGQRLTFSKSRLETLSDGHLKTLYLFSHILNRLKLLEAQVFSHWGAARTEGLDSVRRAAAEYGVIESILALAGELKEASEAIRLCYHSTQLSKTVNPKLSQSAQDALRRINDHCKSGGVVHVLRNKFSHHHSPDEILDVAKSLFRDDPHVAVIFEEDNNFFNFAADVRILAVAKALSLQDPNTLVTHLIDTVVKGAYGDVSTALTNILTVVLSEVGIGIAPETLTNVPAGDELVANYFFYA